MSDFEFKIPCPKCGALGAWKRSARRHGRKGHYFVRCSNCGYKSQATDNGPYDTNPAKNRGDERLVHAFTLRLTDQEHERIMASGLTRRDIVRLVIDNL